MMSVNKMLVAAATVLCLPAVAPAQQVFKEITNPRLEDLLKAMNISYSKGSDGKTTTWYDYTSKTYKIRLWSYNGKDLMLDVILPKVGWEEINKWNGNAKFSRARLDNNNTVLESNLDLMGGVTEETIKHFIIGFDLEVARWTKNVAVAPPGKDPVPPAKDPVPPAKDPAAGPVFVMEDVFNKVTSERLEKVLNALNIKYKKQQGKGNNVIYDYTNADGFNIRLVNFGGDDLMIDCTYPKATLAKVNDWNLKRSFIRAVLYPGNGNPYTSLESNLDCVAGCNDAIIRYFVTSFDIEAREFDKHLKAP